MAKSVGMARLACRCWLYARKGWRTRKTWATYRNARAYLRQHAQRKEDGRNGE